MYDLLLKNGHVIDPANGIDARRDVAVAGGKIAAVAEDIDPASATKAVDVGGRYVTPGLIDIHAHVYHTRNPEGLPTGLSLAADAHMLPSGVTTVVDTGTAGANHFAHFKETCIDRQKIRILAYVNIVDDGMLGTWEQDPTTFNAEKAAATAAAFPDVCVGIKTAHYWTHKPYDDIHTPWAAVDKAIEAAELCGKHVMYDFWHRPDRTYEDLLLVKARPGDIHTHMYAQQFPIVDEHGKPYPYLFKARERGVHFDLGHGAGSFWFRNAVPAMENGWGPDSISTDLHLMNIHGVVLDMTTTMSKILNLGMPLSEVIHRSTITPARAIGRPNLGTLSVGSDADIAVLDVRHGEFGFVDCGYAKMIGDRKIECSMTVRAGAILFDREGLGYPRWQEAPEAYWKIRPPLL